MGLNKNQIKVRDFGKGTLLVEAGPGSGKTKVIVERIKHLINDEKVDPESFLVITFTRKAAENLKIKLKESLPKEKIDLMQISTIHSFCLEFLKNRNRTINLVDDDSEERKILFVQKYKKELGFTGLNIIKNHQIPSVVDKFGEYTNFNVKSDELIDYLEEEKTFSQDYIDFINENKYFSNKKIKEEELKDDWYNARFQQVARAYPIYLKLLEDNSLVDYNTLQLKTLEELKSNPETQYKTVLIDEFQDTDPLQYEIFKILLKHAEYFTAVGDIDQRIYSFRSTFKDYFDEMEKFSDSTRISLNCNYRSTETIVDLTDKFIKHQRSKNSQKDLKANNDEYDNPAFIIKTEKPKQKRLHKQAYEDEAHKIFKIIQELHENKQCKYSDVAILYRKHSAKTIGYLVDCFEKHRIPFSIKGGSDLSDKKEIKAIILMWWYITRKTDNSYISSQDEYNWLNLKGFCDENLEGAFWCLSDSTKQYVACLQERFEDEVSKIRNKLSPPKGKTPKKFSTTHSENEDILIEIYQNVKKPVIDLEKITDKKDNAFFEKLESIRDKIFSEEPPEILEIYYCLLSMSDYFNNAENNFNQMANLAVLTQTMSNYESYISPTDARGFYFFLTQVIRNYSANYGDENGIQLMTVHAAKGLEFPITIVSSLEKDEFPMKVKDPDRERTNIMFRDTFYTPNKYLGYKYFTDENGVYRPITIEEENEREMEEEERVIYVAMTRAADLLILSCVGEIPEQIENIESCLEEFSFDELSEVEINKHFDNQEKEQLVLNYSKYTKFLSCPFKYNLGYNLGFTRPGMKAANRGTVFHEIMENVNLKLKENQEVSIEDLTEITHDTYNSMFEIEENPKEYEEFKSNVINYFDKYSKNREVLEAELDFEIDRGEYLLNGAIDLIYKTGENEITILDYKYAEYDEDHIDGYTKQLHLYAAALKELPEYKDYTIKNAITHFVLGDYPHVVEITDEKINEELKCLDKVANKINKGLECIKGVNKEENINNYFPKVDNCGKCSYRIFCKK